MKKPIIGILAPRKTNQDDPFECESIVVDNFPKRVMEAGGIPFGLLFPDEKFNEEEMEMCDGLIIQGGAHLGSSHICALHYAYLHKIPVLGVCLGMQTMAGYDWFSQKYLGKIDYDIISRDFDYSDELNYLDNKAGHNVVDPFNIKDIDKCKHKVTINKESRLFDIFHTEILNMPSLHNMMARKEIFDNSHIFKVTGMSDDDVIEVVESQDDWWAIGVQFHPELEDENLKVFKKLIEESLKHQLDINSKNNYYSD